MSMQFMQMKGDQKCLQSEEFENWDLDANHSLEEMEWFRGLWSEAFMETVAGSTRRLENSASCPWWAH
jgi:hypothetical protein